EHGGSHRRRAPPTAGTPLLRHLSFLHPSLSFSLSLTLSFLHLLSSPLLSDLLPPSLFLSTPLSLYIPLSLSTPLLFLSPYVSFSLSPSLYLSLPLSFPLPLSLSLSARKSTRLN